MSEMVIVTSVEIAVYRAELAADPEALRALELIEECEGDIEDAAIVLALHAGQEPDRSERWLEGLAKRWRAVICQSEIKEPLAAGSLASTVQLLVTRTTLPSGLATPVAIYVLKTGVESFCKPFEATSLGVQD